MKITSHFIWIQLKSEHFVDLYTDLQKELWEEKGVLEFQNILSVHITLYYLSRDISKVHMEEIRSVLSGLTMPSVNMDSFAYFWDIRFPKLCYISPDSQDALIGLNDILKARFPEYSNIPDNMLKFIPHITLFKIRNTEVFLAKREKLEKILTDYLLRSGGFDLCKSFEIFKVNSEFTPEIQIPIR